MAEVDNSGLCGCDAKTAFGRWTKRGGLHLPNCRDALTGAEMMACSGSVDDVLHEAGPRKNAARLVQLRVEQNQCGGGGQQLGLNKLKGDG